MFTGIIEHFAIIEKIEKENGGDLFLQISTSKPLKRNLDIGCSISCNGTCLTLINKKEAEDKFYLDFQLSEETCSKTSIGEWKSGSEINIEFALRVGDELGGHMVLGHVDGVAKIIDIQKNDDSHIFIISPPKDLEKFIAKKGSVTIDGVSLTVNEIENNQFSLNIISHTWQNTIFRNYRINDLVNLEIDVVARYINK